MSICFIHHGCALYGSPNRFGGTNLLNLPLVSHIEGFLQFCIFFNHNPKDIYDIQNSRQRSWKPMVIKSSKNIKQMDVHDQLCQTCLSEYHIFLMKMALDAPTIALT
jgi:hypothetical protein